MRPLNGTKTHPLSKHALDQLASIGRGATPCSDVNPGVIDRLLREALVEIVQLPSPFVWHRGKLINHLQITDAGRARL